MPPVDAFDFESVFYIPVLVGPINQLGYSKTFLLLLSSNLVSSTQKQTTNLNLWIQPLSARKNRRNGDLHVLRVTDCSEIDNEAVVEFVEENEARFCTGQPPVSGYRQSFGGGFPWEFFQFRQAYGSSLDYLTGLFLLRLLLLVVKPSLILLNLSNLKNWSSQSLIAYYDFRSRYEFTPWIVYLCVSVFSIYSYVYNWLNLCNIVGD